MTYYAGVCTAKRLLVACRKILFVCADRSAALQYLS